MTLRKRMLFMVLSFFISTGILILLSVRGTSLLSSCVSVVIIGAPLPALVDDLIQRRGLRRKGLHLPLFETWTLLLWIAVAGATCFAIYRTVYGT